MKRRVLNVLSAILLCVIIIFCIFATPYLLNAARWDVLGSELARRRAQSFSGVINIWQIDSFEGGTGSRTAWLNRRLGELEKKYNGVYFVVKSVEAEMLPELLKHSRPDLISFGTGTFTRERALELFTPFSPEAALVPSLEACCEGLAAPLFFGGYCLLTGTEYTSRVQSFEDLPAYLNLKCGTIMYNKQRVEVIPLVARADNTGLAALALRVAAGSLGIDITTYNSDELWDCYNYNRLCATALCTQRQLYRLTAAEARSKGRSSVIIPLAGYTDMVQAIGITKGADDKKLKILQNVINYLCSSAVQATVGEIGTMPAELTALSGIRYENQYMQALCDVVKQQPLSAPSLFYNPADSADEFIKYLTKADASYFDKFKAGLFSQ